MSLKSWKNLFIWTCFWEYMYYSLILFKVINQQKATQKKKKYHMVEWMSNCQEMKQLNWNQEAMGLNLSLLTNTFCWSLLSLEVDDVWVQCQSFQCSGNPFSVLHVCTCPKSHGSWRMLLWQNSTEISPTLAISELAGLEEQLHHSWCFTGTMTRISNGEKSKMDWYSIKAIATTNLPSNIYNTK